VKCSGLVAALAGVFFQCAAWAEKPAPAAPPPPPSGGALEAVSLIPKEAAKRLARVEAREGAPFPERWYVLVFDPDVPTGVREFVVSKSRIVAARQLSQFADTLTEPDSFVDTLLRADADYCIRLGQVYAATNGLKAVSFDFELARPGGNLTAPSGVPKTEATWPIWRLTVLDASGDQIGVLLISAVRGTVLSHDGFEKTPDSAYLPPQPTLPPASVLYPKPPAPPKKTPPKSSGKKGKNN